MDDLILGPTESTTLARVTKDGSALPDYPAVVRDEPERHFDGNLRRGSRWLIHTRKQAEAGKIEAPATRIPHEGKIT